MTLTPAQRARFEELSRPLIKWINDNCDPHHTVLITPTSAELVGAVAAVNTTDYVKD